MSRTRTRPLGRTTIRYGYHKDPGCTRPWGLLSTGTYSMGYETIVDSNNGRARPPSNCQHEKIVYSSMPTAVSVWQNSTTHFYGPGQFSTPGSIMSRVVQVTDDFVKNFRRNAMKQIDSVSRIADEFSLLNNIIELPDLGDMFKRYLDLKDKFKSSRVSPRDIAGSVNYLDWQFGIAPLLKDINTLRGNIQTVRDRIAKLSTGEEQPISSSLQGPIRAYFPKAYGYNRHLALNGVISGTVNGSISAFIPGISEADFQLKVLADILGLHVDILVVYDAIPFSWLLDWFLPIGDSLKSIVDRRWVKADLDGQAYISTKTAGNFTIEGTKFENNSGWGDVLVRPGSGEFLRYSRLAINFGRSRRAKVLAPVVPNFDTQKNAILASLVQAKAAGRKG